MMDKTGRNDPCPCGSGKKYKSCCWKKEQVEKGKAIKFKATQMGSSMGFLSKGFDMMKGITDGFKDRVSKIDPVALENQLKERQKAAEELKNNPTPIPPPEEP